MLRACTGEEDVLLTAGGDHADLASTVAFKLAKKEKRPPQEIAADIAKKLGRNPELGDIQVEAAGPYLNFRFGPTLLAEAVREAVEPGYGSRPRRSSRVVLEHTKPHETGINHTIGIVIHVKVSAVDPQVDTQVSRIHPDLQRIPA
ncbi:MAG TPA: hypothetical protein PLP90_01540, partial [Methanoculleus sp.]|nr:hypothetical protein [Methanoculleus sp.]